MNHIKQATQLIQPQTKVSTAQRNRLIEIRQKYYNMPCIKFAIAKQCKGRELAFLTKDDYKPTITVRYLQASHSNYITKHFEAFRILTAPFTNLYSSLARFDFLRVFTYNMKKRRHEEDYIDFQKNFDKYVCGYDIAFDFDDSNPTLINARKETGKFKKILEDSKVPYTLKFSGNRGFHIKIPFEFVNTKIIKFQDFVDDVGEMIYNIKGIYGFETLDETIIDIKRVLKLDYSLDKDKICLPLDDWQFANFTVDMAKFDNVMQTVNLANRGNLLRNYGLSREELSNNLTKFMDEYI